MTDGLFDTVRLAAGADAATPYASVSDILAADDLIELDMVIPHWGKIRIRALSLEQEDRIELDSLVKHPKTGEWYQPPGLKMAITLRELIQTPSLDKEQAKGLVKRNPRNAEGVVQWGRMLSGLNHATIEKLIADNLRNDGAPPPVDDAGAGDTVLGQDDSGA